jgi:hypothetical protein
MKRIYQPFDNIMNFILKFYYDKNLLISKSYFVPSENITSYKKLKKNQLNFPLRLNQLSVKYFKPHYRYDNMTKEQIDLILKIIPINPYLNNFFW